MPSLIQSLLDPRCYPHPVAQVRVIETHISWLLLTGNYAYKLKKPVKLPFVDFSTLERRHHYCLEELRLNRRFAPELYLDVVAVTGSLARPSIAGDGPAIEFAVKMREFPQDALLDRRLVARDGDSPAQQEHIADWLAEELPLLLREQPWKRATVVVAGNQLEYAPDSEIVIASPATTG